MIVEINDFAFGKLFNYEYEMFCNGRKSVFKVNNRAERVTEIENDDVVEIRAKNTVYSSESIGSIILSYWLLGFLKKSRKIGDEPFGFPFDAYIQFRTNSEYVKLKANKIWENEPFSVVDGQLTIEKNEFVSYKKYLSYWYFGMVLPTNILFLLVIAISILFFGGIGLNFSILLIIGFIGKNVYEFNVLRRIKTKMIK